VCLIQSVWRYPSRRKLNAQHGLPKSSPLLPTKVVFNICTEENSQFIMTGLLTPGAFHAGLTTTTRITRRHKTHGIGWKVHIVSNQTSNNRPTTDGSATKIKVKTHIIASYNQAHADQTGCNNHSTKLISKSDSETKVTKVGTQPMLLLPKAACFKIQLWVPNNWCSSQSFHENGVKNFKIG
jgi:hypothetical protein